MPDHAGSAGEEDRSGHRRQLVLEVRPVDLEAAPERGLLALGQRQVGADHLGDQVGERRLRRPIQLLARLARVADERVDLGRAEVDRVDADDRLPDA